LCTARDAFGTRLFSDIKSRRQSKLTGAEAGIFYASTF
jgi:hypothetical protein